MKPFAFCDIPASSALSAPECCILNAGLTHRREQVAGVLWPDSLDI
ncbi:MAG: hypothetical protein M3220_19575 [Chloroflexota bacterium]|nr:hypothetical protein [Chloroflexota bacterium]